MTKYDLAISYIWEYDIEFVQLIEKIFHENKLTTFLISYHNVEEIIEKLKNKELNFTAYLDRASDVDSDFEPIAQILRKRHAYLINPHKRVHKFTNKSYMHRLLSKKNLNIPKSYILPAYYFDHSLKITEDDLDEIGKPFVIKPSIETGGGQGVIINAYTLKNIQKIREENPKEEYIVQEKITPCNFGRHRAWFRVYWAFNKVIPVWWNDLTHIYDIITKEQIKKYKLEQLFKIARKLAKYTRIDYFSTEIAVDKNHKFYIIDYINDQCDFRLKSNHPDGVPDEIVIQFINEMKKKIDSLKK
ncbi:ATP-grasp domain-containing protein [Melioribacter sp. OK-6-Me]|uniref:ATP-grasp domain-containing protein n=1 Tax=unclassified Melioribacter TaxID=2627329 RepID=UPI003ED8DCAE